MGLETVVNIADLVRTNPPGSDPKSQGDDHLRNIKTALLNNIVGYPGAVTVTGTDGGAVNAYTLTPAAGTLIAYGLRMVVVFSPAITNTGAVTLNISGLGAKNVLSVSGAALVANDLVAGNLYAAFYNGTEFRLLSITKNYADQLAFAATLPSQAGNAGKFITTDGTSASWADTFTIPITFSSRLNEAKGADIASASTINLTTATGNLVHITGTTTVNAITIPVGAERTCIADGIFTITNSASLLCPGAANIVTAVGDRFTVRGDTAGANIVHYQRADGSAIRAPFALGSPTVLTPAVATTLQALNIVTAASNGYLIELEAIRPNAGTDTLRMRFANAGVADTASNYISGFNSNGVAAAGFSLSSNTAAAGKGASGILTLQNLNAATPSKGMQANVGTDNSGTYPMAANTGIYIGGAVSGFSFDWAAGASFAATGAIRIYPILNT